MRMLINVLRDLIKKLKKIILYKKKCTVVIIIITLIKIACFQDIFSFIESLTQFLHLK